MAGIPDLTDGDVLARLRAVPRGRWEAIGEALAAVEAEDAHVRWEGGGPRTETGPDGVERTVWHLAYPVYSDAVERLRNLLGDLVVVFAWMDWEGLRRYADAAALHSAPVADAVRMITAVLRAERFSDGSIAGAIDRGILPAAVRRVLTWHHENGRAAPPGSH